MLLRILGCISTVFLNACITSIVYRFLQRNVDISEFTSEEFLKSYTSGYQERMIRETKEKEGIKNKVLANVWPVYLCFLFLVWLFKTTPEFLAVKIENRYLAWKDRKKSINICR